MMSSPLNLRLIKTQGAKLEQLLRLFPKSPHMCITNDGLKDSRWNDTVCRCVKVKLKAITRTNQQWKNWEGRKVWTVSTDDIVWVEFEHWPNPPRNVPLRFRLKPIKILCAINFHVPQAVT